MYLRYFILYLFTLGIIYNLLGQENINFSNYTINDGLADNRINDIVKDNQGYIWLASQNGITRFDGHNFVIFNKNKICFIFLLIINF